MKFEDLANERIVIWGAGREGRAVQAELAKRGISAIIAITGTSEVPRDVVEFAVAGKDAEIAMESANAVIVSPGIPHTNPEYQALVEIGIQLTSLMDLWLNEHYEHVIAVTGTKGKSTTAALIHHVVESLGLPVAVLGNLGIPVTQFDPSGERLAVVEVSSYQAASITQSPRVAVITSLYPEHLTWHGGYEQYVTDKLNLLMHGPERVIVPSEPGLADLVRERVPPGTRVSNPADHAIRLSDTHLGWAGTEIDLKTLPIHGRHNAANAALALAAVDAYFELSEEQKTQAVSALVTFAPLAHRLERVPSRDDRAWIDDSLATAPEAVIAALETFSDSEVILIAGGADRGVSFAPLVEYLPSRANTASVQVAAVGPAGRRLAEELAGTSVRVRVCENFSAALAVADEQTAVPVVLLSPGAPSFDEFASYEERSAAFRAFAQSRLTQSRLTQSREVAP